MSASAKQPAFNGVYCAEATAFAGLLPNASVDLIYLDPPFATQTTRTSRKSGERYDDRWTGGVKQFLAFMLPCLDECRRILSPKGTLYLHLDYRAASYARVLLDTLFGERCFLNEVIWQYRTGGVSRSWFGRKHDTILVYAKRIGHHTFNVLREGVYRTDGLNHDENGKPYKNTKRGRLYFNVNGPALTDVWDIPFLSTVASERVGWPTQKPLALLDRIIRASSNPGDVIADFFCGSGTTLVAAKQLGRRWIGCDAESRAVRLAKQRLSRTRSPDDLAISAPKPSR
ncbi:MAG: site-specific DNA-methyltransferase [Phycisphaerae bacterium]|nr:site-specific DNA-methyltransferase [Phycisphaerae bacterium]